MAIAKNIETQARYSKALFIWTDCDREGENIGQEVRDVAWKGKPNLQVKRAKFSNIERAYVQSISLCLFNIDIDSHIIRAAKQPVDLDMQQSNAVAARIELDLRIGAAFTRLQTVALRKLGGPLNQATISYGNMFMAISMQRLLRESRLLPVSHSRICS